MKTQCSQKNKTKQKQKQKNWARFSRKSKAGMASGTQVGHTKGLGLALPCSSLLKNSQLLPHSYCIKSQVPFKALQNTTPPHLTSLIFHHALCLPPILVGPVSLEFLQTCPPPLSKCPLSLRKSHSPFKALLTSHLIYETSSVT